MSGIICDEQACSGCLACIVACIDAHYEGDCADAVSLRIHEETTTGSGLVRYQTRSCRHCEDAACIEACPQQLFEKADFGLVVLTDREACSGCRVCAEACPFDAIRFDADGKAVKCDGCIELVRKGEKPACVQVCPVEALREG